MSPGLQIPSGLLEISLQDLRSWGQQGVESIVFFLGRGLDSHRVVHTIALAEEPGISRGSGLLRVSEDWMLELTDLCAEREEFIVGHMHSHGTSAFHSETDEHHIFHAPGCFSLVVPSFAQTTESRTPASWAVLIGNKHGFFDSADAAQLQITAGSGKAMIVSEDGSRHA